MQLLVVSLCLLAAAGYLARRAWRTWFGASECGGGCCGSEEKSPGNASLITSDELLGRLRKK